MPIDLAGAATSLDRAPRHGAATRWLSVLSHLDPRYGGLSAVVPQLASTLAASGRFQVQVEAFCLADEHYRPPSSSELSISYWPTSRKAWLLDRALSTRFREQLASASGMHIHGLWEQSTLMAARAARTAAKPYILSAHGMLEPWALARSRTKKRLYAALFERSNLNHAACLHALTQAEARNYRDYGCTQPIAVIPNGVTIPAALSPALFDNAFPAVRGKRMLLFLGRLHEKKGVDLLIRAWKQSRAPHEQACLVLAGPSEDQTRTRVEQLAVSLGLAHQVIFPGMLDRAMKWSALAAAEGFVLPSSSEGLSVACLEAMGAGLPVILSDHCNLPEAVEHGAGWQVPTEIGPLAEAIDEWLANPTAANREIGQRGAALVRARYSWSRVGAQMGELYAWVEGAGEAPQSLELQGGRP